MSWKSLKNDAMLKAEREGYLMKKENNPKSAPPGVMIYRSSFAILFRR